MYDGDGGKIRLTLFEASPPPIIRVSNSTANRHRINILLPLVFCRHDHCPSYHTCISRATEHVIVGLRCISPSHGFRRFLSLRARKTHVGRTCRILVPGILTGTHGVSSGRVSRRPRNHRHNCGVYAGGRRHDDVRSAANIPKRPRHRRDTPLLDIPRDLGAPAVRHDRGYGIKKKN